MTIETLQIPCIGIIHSPFKVLENMPIQPVGAKGVTGEVVVRECYVDGLKDLDGFSHIYLIYHLHKAARVELQLIPFMDKVKRGVFATRSPLRPAGIGLSVVKLLAVKRNLLQIEGVDVLDGTPLIDIKPYIPQFDHREGATTGWMQGSVQEIRKKRSDKRFA